MSPDRSLPSLLLKIPASLAALAGAAALWLWHGHTAAAGLHASGWLPTPVGAVGLIVAGLAVWAVRPGAATVSRGVGGILALLLVGIAVLRTIPTFGPDTIFRGAERWPRMSVGTASALFAFALAVAGSIFADGRGRRLVVLGLAATVLPALFALLGHLYGVRPDSFISGLVTGMPASTSILLLLLVIGMLGTDAMEETRGFLGAPTPGGRLMRRLVPAIVVVMVGAGWIRLLGQRIGWYGTEFGVTILVSTCLVILISMVVMIARSIDQSDARDRSQAAMLRLANVVTRSQDGTVLSWNVGSERLYGWRAEEAVGRNVHELLHPDYPLPLAEITARLAQEGHWAGEVIHHARDGSPRFVASHWVLHQEDPRDAPIVLEMNTDVTARRGAEARFAAVVEAAPSGMVMVDDRGVITLANREAERIFAYARGELLGRRIEELVPRRVRERHPGYREQYTEAAAARSMGAGRDLYGLRQDGSEIPVEIGLNPVTWGGERSTLATVVDITQRKRAEDELRRSNEELERFAYVASHDLQEPLRTVTSYMQLFVRRYGGGIDGDGREFIEFAVQGAQRMQRLIEDLLSFSRVGTRGGAMVPVDLDGVVDLSLADLAAAVREADAEIVRMPLPAVLADPGQIQQVITNLVGNALKFRGAERPRIIIDAVRDDARWAIRIADNGIGIQPEYADRIFIIFQRLHTREEYPGTGVGLALCRKIVERHGGRIGVVSEPGRGSTFTFTLAPAPEAVP